jgi:hypothetical protein
MDKAGIKVKLAEWNKFSIEERTELAKKLSGTEEEAKRYKDYLATLIKRYTGKEATLLEIDQHPGWADLDKAPGILQEKIKEFGWLISAEQWKGLTSLQRFALLKLCQEGHENKNFLKALKEFSILS